MDALFLNALGATRLQGNDPTSSITLNKDGSLLQATLQCQVPAATSGAVSQLLLDEFCSSSSTSARSQPRGVKVTVAGDSGAAGRAVAAAAQAPPADAGGAREPQQEQPGSLSVQFSATEEAAEDRVEDAARLFEAYWQYHTKAAKSDLHCRMRQRLSGLRQQLLLAKCMRGHEAGCA